MSISKVFVSLTLTATVALAWSDRPAFAADTPTPAPIASGPAVPVSVAAPGCATCAHGAPTNGCNTCGKKWLPSFPRKDQTTQYGMLCPGACFGYFQTQWRKWDDVCPYPYAGTAPATAAPQQPGGALPPPRTIEPKMPEPKQNNGTSNSSNLPPIPIPGKFAQ